MTASDRRPDFTKMTPISFAINVSDASYQRKFILFSYLRSAYNKFVEISKIVYFSLSFEL